MKSTKVPTLQDDTVYSDWKTEIQIWEHTNTDLGCTKKVLAGTLFESLIGQARSTVLSELEVSKIVCEEGVENIKKTLDDFFLENEVKTAFEAHDELVNFRRKLNTSFKDFLVEFQLKVNKVKQSGTKLSDGVLAYTLLQCANLSKEKVDMIRATCDNLDYKTVKKQLQKIALDGPTSKENVKFTSTNTEAHSSQFKVEDVYHNRLNSNSDSSDGEQIEEGYYGYNNQQRNFNQHTTHRSSNKRFQLNPVDKCGHLTACDWCKCVYHYLDDCPYAPQHMKSNYSRKSSNHRSYNSNSRKPL